MGYIEITFIYEKINVLNVAKGEGGEYPVQKGFGWTNGALLDIMAKFGKELDFKELENNYVQILEEISKAEPRHISKSHVRPKR